MQNFKKSLTILTFAFILFCSFDAANKSSQLLFCLLTNLITFTPIN